MADLNYELAPRQGMTASQRKAELDSARFVAVRNLAYMIYKKHDGSPLMSYQETLEDREKVKHVILQYEIAASLVANDLGGTPVAGPTNGASAPMVPASLPAPQQAMAPTQMAPTAPYATPAVAPPPTPQMAPASPQQAAMAASGAPPQQVEPVAAVPAGRKRRSNAGGAPTGVAVAPPPGGPTIMPPTQVPALGFTPGAPTVVPTMPTPGPIMPGPATSGPPTGFQQTYAGPVGSVQQSDLGPVLQRLEAIGAELGRGLSAVSKDVDEVRQRVANIEGVVSKDLAVNLQALASLQHIYGSFPNLLEFLKQNKVGATLNDFQKFLAQFTGNPA
jgi:hypothetical protein